MTTLKIDYSQMRAIATDIGTVAGEVRDSLAQLAAAITQLKPAWEGAARAAFDAAELQGNQELAHVAPMLDQIRIALMRTAFEIQGAEQAAANNIEAIVQDDTN
jgi:WXG100 family type VII secretion target